jgi:alkanesulfonate monooxygenase SsuD/methylene tetrahydromethanopterin reductase-like flavin-dependent oxidoreductase (luciferase family)
MGTVKFGWHTPSFPTDGSTGEAFAAQIETVMRSLPTIFDSVWIDDHFWPWATWQAPETPYIECATTIAYLAGAFPNFKYASSVFCQSYRNPGLLAKMVANLQLWTKGNFIFGIGAGWMEREYRAFHIDFPKPAVRLAQMEETIEIAKLLWTETPATYAGQYYSITNAYCEPKPNPLPPICIGGGGEQLTLKIVAKHADWWNFPGGTVETYQHKLDVLRSHCDTVGRDYNSIVKTWSAECVAVGATESEAKRILEASPYNNNAIAGTPTQVAEGLQRYVDIGVEYFILRVVDFPQGDGLQRFAEEVVPLLQG